MKKTSHRRSKSNLATLAVLATLTPVTLVTLMSVALLSVLASGAVGQTPTTADDLGTRLFRAQCSRCHGVFGGGGEGPPLDRPLHHGDDPAVLQTVVKNGILGTQMPEAWQMNDREIAAVVAHVLGLGRVASEPLPGHPERGLEVYRSEGCEACHVIAGAGFALGPELTQVGARRAPAILREHLVDPGAVVDDRYRVVALTLSSGARVRGVRVNEDAFTIQIRDLNHRLHSFDKADLTAVNREPRASLMPSYRQLDASALDDLVAYLASLQGEKP